jgi:hypothetical protein
MFFEGVISNSLLHHLPLPLVALQESRRVVRAGGRVFFRDLCRPQDEATLRSLVERYAGSESQQAQRLFEASLHAALSLDEIRSFVQQVGGDPQTVSVTSDRHWTWSQSF